MGNGKRPLAALIDVNGPIINTQELKRYYAYKNLGLSLQPHQCRSSYVHEHHPEYAEDYRTLSHTLFQQQGLLDLVRERPREFITPYALESIKHIRSTKVIPLAFTSRTEEDAAVITEILSLSKKIAIPLMEQSEIPIITANHKDKGQVIEDKNLKNVYRIFGAVDDEQKKLDTLDVPYKWLFRAWHPRREPSLAVQIILAAQKY